MALNIIYRKKENNFIIFSDSMSSLQAVKSFRLELDLQFCNLPLTVNHILVECPNLNTIRQRFFRVSSLKDIFDNIDNHVIIDFIKETHFYALV